MDSFYNGTVGNASMSGWNPYSAGPGPYLGNVGNVQNWGPQRQPATYGSPPNFPYANFTVPGGRPPLGSIQPTHIYVSRPAAKPQGHAKWDEERLKYNKLVRHIVKRNNLTSMRSTATEDAIQAFITRQGYSEPEARAVCKDFYECINNKKKYAKRAQRKSREMPPPTDMDTTAPTDRANRDTSETADSADMDMETTETADSADMDMETTETADSADMDMETTETADSADMDMETTETADSADMDMDITETVDSADMDTDTTETVDSADMDTDTAETVDSVLSAGAVESESASNLSAGTGPRQMDDRRTTADRTESRFRVMDAVDVLADADGEVIAQATFVFEVQDKVTLIMKKAIKDHLAISGIQTQQTFQWSRMAIRKRGMVAAKNTQAKEASGKNTQAKTAARDKARAKAAAGKNTQAKAAAGKNTQAKAAAGKNTQAKVAVGKNTQAKEAAGKNTQAKAAAGKNTQAKAAAGKNTQAKAAAGKNTQAKAAAIKKKKLMKTTCNKYWEYLSARRVLPPAKAFKAAAGKRIPKKKIMFN